MLARKGRTRLEESLHAASVRFGEWPPLPSNAGLHMTSRCYRGPSRAALNLKRSGYGICVTQLYLHKIPHLRRPMRCASLPERIDRQRAETRFLAPRRTCSDEPLTILQERISCSYVPRLPMSLRARFGSSRACLRLLASAGSHGSLVCPWRFSQRPWRHTRPRHAAIARSVHNLTALSTIGPPLTPDFPIGR